MRPSSLIAFPVVTQLPIDALFVSTTSHRRVFFHPRSAPAPTPAVRLQIESLVSTTGQLAQAYPDRRTTHIDTLVTSTASLEHHTPVLRGHEFFTAPWNRPIADSTVDPSLEKPNFLDGWPRGLGESGDPERGVLLELSAVHGSQVRKVNPTEDELPAPSQLSRFPPATGPMVHQVRPIEVIYQVHLTHRPYPTQAWGT
ncbi:hypothetical protein NMY22_g19714 [Coprinellus aureogranulatus]|nr:hypothetical protein NMY22_g19714 [Coprinellus aureogranulatus]